MDSIRRVAALAAAVTLTYACSGSGGTESPPPTSLALEVVFPPPRSLHEGESITVRGSSAGAPAVESIEVDGVPASSSDGLRTWQVTYPLAQGDAAIGITARGTIAGSPREERVTRVVTARPLLAGPRGMEVDATHDEWVVETASGLMVIDRGTGARRRVQVEGALAELDGTGQRAFLIGCGGRGNLCTVYVRSLADGAELATVGLGDASGGIAFDEARNRLIHHGSAQKPTLVATDLASGASSLVWSPVDDESFSDFGPIAFDAARARVIGTDGPRPGRFLAAFDLDARERTVLSPAGADAAADFDSAFLHVLTRAGDRSFVARYPDGDSAALTLLDVDLATGERHELSGPTRGAGPSLRGTQGLALEESRGRLLVPAPSEQAILGVDLLTGDRSVLLADRIGDGPPLAGGPFAVDRDRERAFLVTGRKLIEIDLTTGDRRVVSDDADGAGPPELCTASAITAAGDRIWVAADGLCGPPKGTLPLVEVDRATGVRTGVSSDARGGGPGLEQVSSLAFDGEGRLFAIDPSLGAVFAVDLASGDRHSITDGTRGSGPPFGQLDSVAYDPVRARPVVGCSEGLLAVDPTTGDRVLLAPLTDATDPTKRVEPFAIALDRSGARAWFADQGHVAEADLGSGTTHVLDASFERIDGLGTTPASDRLVGYTSLDVNAVLLIDPRTGERVIVSR